MPDKVVVGGTSAAGRSPEMSIGQSDRLLVGVTAAGREAGLDSIQSDKSVARSIIVGHWSKHVGRHEILSVGSVTEGGIAAGESSSKDHGQAV
ncbi:hypothetical protein AQUCO_00600065v1 [Aquilegia coerulea]|uniref:Uncharacterized protein n=1 Tax=Aquilegia coerulea TaxID=218851 RepID=A0A2G5EMS7_AQUCA|nr:hypothetical protein AQUCO_00600065v1 [Aquilegia coerulea]